MDRRFSDRMRRQRAEAILQETAVLAGEKGWDGFRVEDVAQRVGVAKGTIYLDFPDKGELVAAAIQRCAVDLLHGLQTAVERSEGEGDRLTAALRFLSGLPVEHPDLAALVRWAGTEPARDYLHETELYIRTLVAAAQRSGSIDGSVDQELAAQVVLAAAAVPAVSRLATELGPDKVVAQLANLISLRTQ